MRMSGRQQINKLYIGLHNYNALNNPLNKPDFAIIVLQTQAVVWKYFSGSGEAGEVYKYFSGAGEVYVNIAIGPSPAPEKCM